MIITLIPMHCSWYFCLYKFAVFLIHKHINHHKSYQCNHKSSPIKMKNWPLCSLIYYYFFTGNLPPTPSWVSERPYLSRDYVTAGLTTSSAVVSILILPNSHIHWLKIVLGEDMRSSNEKSVQKPRACKTKSFFKAVTLCRDFKSAHALFVTVCCVL